MNVPTSGVAAAIMFTPTNIITESENQLRVAFDGDAVLFSDESELVFKSGGLQEYLKNEKQNVEIRMNEVWKIDDRNTFHLLLIFFKKTTNLTIWLQLCWPSALL